MQPDESLDVRVSGSADLVTNLILVGMSSSLSFQLSCSAITADPAVARQTGCWMDNRNYPVWLHFELGPFHQLYKGVSRALSETHLGLVWALFLGQPAVSVSARASTYN